MNRPAVLLYANRAVDPVRTLTGVGRYVLNVVSGLSRIISGSELDYFLTTPEEGRGASWLPPEIGYRKVRGPRPALNFSWTAVSRPKLELLTPRFDFLHVLYPSFPVPTNKPAVVTVHDTMPLRHPEWYDRYVAKGFERTFDYAMKHGWNLIVDSEYVAGQVCEMTGCSRDRISVIHLGVGDEFRVAATTDAKAALCRRFGLQPKQFVLAVGNVSTRKNLTTLIQAVAHSTSKATLALAGSPHTSADAVRQMIDSLGLHDRVHLLGFVTDSDLPLLVQSALALTHPSVDEGFGFPPLEAMACGTPVLAANAGSLPEIVGEAGLLLDPYDVDEWAHTIDRITDDENLRDALTRAGTQRSQLFTWEKTANSTHRVHQHLIA